MKKLGELSELITKGTTPKKFVSQGIKFIKIECFDGDKIDLQKCLFIEEHTHNKELKRSILKENDLLFAIAGATIGKINIITDETLPANTNQALAIIRLKEKENSKFIYQILKSEIMQRYIKDSISVGAQPNLNLEQMNNFSFFYPSHSEQKKIATFLSLIDERIQTQSKIIEDLKILIKITSGKIFTQKMRFKDNLGNNFPNWEMKKLEELCEIAKSGGTPTSTNKSYYNGDIPFLSISDMTSQGKYLTKTSNSISKLGLEKSSSWLVPKYSLIYSMYASVGFVAINKISIATSQAVLNLIIKKETNLEFMYYTLIDFQKNIAQFITTGTQGNLNAQSVKNFNIPIPSLEEQTKIARFLSSIDEKIEIENLLLNQLQSQKKYLLSKLFI